MDIERLRVTLGKLKMPEQMKARIVVSCAETAPDKKAKAVNAPKRTALIAAVLSVLLCLSAIGAAAAAGYFKDLIRADGAVVGTAYEQATEDLTLSASVDGGQLHVTVTMLYPARPPYSEFEQLSIGSCRIADMSGKVVLENVSTGPAPVLDGKAELTLPLDGLVSGRYTLTVSLFTGSKKADQPLPVSGTWQYEFEI